MGKNKRKQFNLEKRAILLFDRTIATIILKTSLVGMRLVILLHLLCHVTKQFLYSFKK